MKKGKKISKSWKLVVQGLPLAGAVITVFLPVSLLGRQFAMLIVLIWLQVFFIAECLLAGK